MRTYRSEFPDYDDALIIPAGFVDDSWKNDTCPAINSASLGLHIYQDYKDPARRENGPIPRYSVLECSEEHGIGDTIIDTDNWEDVLQVIEKRVKERG